MELKASNWYATRVSMRLAAVMLALGGCSAVPHVSSSSPTAIEMSTREDLVRLADEAERALAEGHLADGGAIYVRIVTEFPGNARAWFRLGSVYLRTGQYGAAQMACERALRLEPGMAKAQANLALAHLYQFRTAALQAMVSLDVPEQNRRALIGLLRDVDHAVAPEGTSR